MSKDSDHSKTSPREIRIGSKSDNDLVFKRQTVSGHHARIYWDDQHGQWLIEDLGSTNGTYIKGVRLGPRTPVPVRLGEAIFLGKSFHFVLGEDLLGIEAMTKEDSTTEGETRPERDARLVSFEELARAVRIKVEDDHAPLLGRPGVPRRPRLDSTSSSEETLVGFEQAQLTQELPDDLLRQASADASGPAAPATPGGHDLEVGPPPLDAPSISIGYSDDNTVQIKNPVVSGHHARLYRLDEAFVLEDQGSTNGTWFRGERILRIEVYPDDIFSLGNHTLTVSDLIKYFPDKSQAPLTMVTDRLPVPDGPIRIGRNPECDVWLDAPMVSAFHARLIPISQGRYRLEDLGSTNGTFVNSRDNRVTSATVGANDVLFFGSYRLPLSRLERLVMTPAREQELVISPDQPVMVIGRDESCDIVLNSPQVSRAHAELRRLSDGTYQLVDLGSINGTYVNGERIKSSVITASDLLSFANYRLRLDISAGVVRRDYHGDIMLQAERIMVRVRDKRSPGGYKTILRDASFTVYPTEFVGLMGPSGAGKTTLMMALNGYSMPTRGRSVLNGYDLYSNYNSFRGNIGYVPQDDIIYRELTVFESLYYTAKLRLPPDTTEEEIHQKIDEILVNLEIWNTRDVIIGDALKKGISGGERKRVNLAQELITEPSLLFLDEPTSGLASQDAINVMNLLRRLADEGRTILLTIHQPSIEAYRKLDNVLYLFHGRVVYYGPAYPDGISFFYPEVSLGTPEGHLLLSDPGNALKALAEDQRAALDSSDAQASFDEVVQRRCERFLNSIHYKDYVYDRAVAPRDRIHLGEGNKQKTARRGGLRQWAILTRRCFTIKRKDTVNTAILLLQAPIIAGVLWLVFAGRMTSYFERLERGPSALFLLVMSAVWFGCSNSAREIVREQAIYRRERMVNLMIPSYALSKFAVLGLLCAVQCAILLAIVYPVLGYEGSPFLMYLVLFLVSLSGVGMGLTLSSVVRSSEASMALVPLLLIPQIMLGGILMPTHELNLPMRLLSNAMVARWGYEGMLHIEYGDDDIESVQSRCGIDVCPDPLAEGHGSSSPSSSDREPLVGAFGPLPGQSYLPRGEGEEEDVCNVLCTNARRGTELTPLERAFGLDLSAADRMRHHYHRQYDVGSEGTQSNLPVTGLVLLVLNCLLFGLVCSILRIKDVEVG